MHSDQISNFRILLHVERWPIYSYLFVLLRRKHRYLSRFFPMNNRGMSIIPRLKIHNFNKIGSRNPYRSIEHEQIYSLGKVRASKSIRTTKTSPKYSRDFCRPHPTSPRPLHKPFKMMDLGLLTYIFRKSVSRRFSWCNSQLLTPSGRRAMKETVFVPYPTTPRKKSAEIIVSTDSG